MVFTKRGPWPESCSARAGKAPRIGSFLLSVALLLSLLPAAGTAVEQDDYTEEAAEVSGESDLQLEEKPSVESAVSVPAESIHISLTNTIVAVWAML